MSWDAGHPSHVKSDTSSSFSDIIQLDGADSAVVSLPSITTVSDLSSEVINPCTDVHKIDVIINHDSDDMMIPPVLYEPYMSMVLPGRQ